MTDAPILGLYDSLITGTLDAEISAWRQAGHLIEVSKIDEEEVAHLLGRFIGETAARAFAGLKGHPDRQVALANRLLAELTEPETVAEGPQQLLSIVGDAPGAATPRRPLTSLSEAALLTNAREDPNLAHELAAELASADRVDLLCAFVKWSGLRILEKPLAELRRRNVPLRVITTTYMGATERRALDRLVNDFGAEVRISYERNSTRLHAKAWLLRRQTGFDTAYVGSSNLSRAALLDGLEWNVRLSSVTTARLLDKFEATFDSYWNRSQFEPYDPATDADRLDEALARSHAGKQLFDIPELVPHPFDHQREMLADLDRERTIHDRHHNLLVAATGTGKTVVAAFDYRNLQQRLGRQPSMLFVAHRREILAQAMRTYRQVLAVPDFGELHVGEEKSRHWRHVFASVQSLTRRILEFDPEHFDVVVIDEFHHAAAPTYRQIINHLKPKELLGLTATPERSDGTWVQDEFFDRRIASELRLWDALDADLLCPFHYFGINDGTDLSEVKWTRGAYDVSALDNVFTGDDARARLVFNAVRDKVSNLETVRGLGFCVSVRHAHYMAEFFTKNRMPSLAVDGSTEDGTRKAALRALAEGEIRFLFAVDLFNEGLDVPDVDTLLMLRPTESATIFLQQLGRGLRRTPEKDVLTVLDFVGQHRKEYRFANRFQALTGFSRGRLDKQVKDDFPLLPSGSQIVLDRVTKERLLADLKVQLGATVNTLSQEIRSLAELSLIRYLEESGRDISDLYRNRRYWTSLLRRTGLLSEQVSPLEEALGRRVRALLHVDDRTRGEAYVRLLQPDGPRYASLSPADQAFARMLFFSFWRDGGGFASYDEALDQLRGEAALCDEIKQVLSFGIDRPRYVAKPMELDGVPLAINARYSTDEVLAAIGWASVGGLVPSTMREGVAWSPGAQCDALFVTLQKNEKEFSPQTMYRDYALTSRLFHWESQNRTSAASVTGRRYQNHATEGSHVLLFTRQRKENELGHPEAFVFHGEVSYVEHRGERPMGITWRLDEEMPADLFRRAAIAG
ncbi:superfamily II DNA or RNA helicase [Nonomuraea thailandensis]|uniref:Superfamily II DNA or RNA helicase n=1 Tax=Nonomuraea thailandensis TaxID=1188745 RepID=A0A9X2K8U0_9ACTN|nr:DEAD/DEAH box helicase [Nonomuraea thailandensis]MCP2364045.1 superfamily II DNA or RNA helicase [Nonomuraea thailandensis]